MSKKVEILQAAKLAIDELIKVLKEPIITHADDDISADKMKNAASAKKLAFDYALAMLHKIEEEESDKYQVKVIDAGKNGFAEGRARGK